LLIHIAWRRLHLLKGAIAPIGCSIIKKSSRHCPTRQYLRWLFGCIGPAKCAPEATDIEYDVIPRPLQVNISQILKVQFNTNTAKERYRSRIQALSTDWGFSSVNCSSRLTLLKDCSSSRLWSGVSGSRMVPARLTPEFNDREEISG
jgi:hypothetical protein